MDTIDAVKAARVWQRVQADNPGTAREAGLMELIVREREAAATYLLLSRRFKGKQSALLRQLFEQEQAHAACLKGIYTLMTGKAPVSAASAPVLEETGAVLRRCYGNQMQCLARYEQRSADPEYGHVFARLAQQEREHCRTVLEILGSIK